MAQIGNSCQVSTPADNVAFASELLRIFSQIFKYFLYHVHHNPKHYRIIFAIILQFDKVMFSECQFRREYEMEWCGSRVEWRRRVAMAMVRCRVIQFTTQQRSRTILRERSGWDMKTRHFNFNEIASFIRGVCVCRYAFCFQFRLPAARSSGSPSSTQWYSNNMTWSYSYNDYVPFSSIQRAFRRPPTPFHSRLIHDDDVVRRMFECKSKTIWMIIHSRLRCLPS